MVFSLSVNALPSFDPKPWQEDLEQAREAFATKYANLEWLVLEREIDLPSLFVDAKARIESASSPADAQAAFDRLARKFGDGHVRFRWPRGHPARTLGKANCASLGYDARMQGSQTAALMPGYTPLTNAPANEFPAGTIQVENHKVGVVKIRIFTPQGLPELCSAALQDLQIAADTPCDEICSDRIMTWGSARMTRDLDAQLRAIKATGAEILLVDIADNGGGTEWAEAAARMVTDVKLKSERIGFVRGAHWAKAFAEKEAELRAAARDAKGEDRVLLKGLADEVSARRREAETPCDSTPLWHGEKPPCRWLGDAFYASGLLASGEFSWPMDKSWASLVYQPAKYHYEEAVWAGPLIVLVDGGTGSAAEQFAAVLQDNRAAVVMGAPTGGAGCGHTDGGTPTTLKNSGGILEMPDCARFRADGSNEVMGIQPDVLVGLRSTDGPHRQGVRVAAKLSEAVRRALDRIR
ncbi:MAG TPA: S41 family peptidase [Steroidobacteraceae bacterium]